MVAVYAQEPNKPATRCLMGSLSDDASKADAIGMVGVSTDRVFDVIRTTINQQRCWLVVRF